MRFLADANVGRAVVAMIRSLGHDCRDGTTLPARMADAEVLQLAATEGRILVTSDKDFGELVFRLGVVTPGVVLIRIQARTEAERAEILLRWWPRIEGRLPGSFVTVGERSVRVRPL